MCRFRQGGAQVGMHLFEDLHQQPNIARGLPLEQPHMLAHEIQRPRQFAQTRLAMLGVSQDALDEDLLRGFEQVLFVLPIHP